MNDLILPSDNLQIMLPADSDKNTRHRLTMFSDFLDKTGQKWFSPDLDAYRDHLFKYRQVTASTVASHIGTVKGRYRRLMTDNNVRSLLIDAAPGATPLEQLAYVNELMTRLQNTLSSEGKVKLITYQDVEDDRHLRLTARQAQDLMYAPGTNTLTAFRDTALITLMLCTGVREEEAVNVDMDDLRQRFGGELSLRIREGKGCKQRLIPYGDLDFCLIVVEKWIEMSGLKGETGPVFRSLWRGGKKLRDGRLTGRSVQNILARYPIMIDGELCVVRPHDLRRTYARNFYLSDPNNIAGLSNNLGHVNHTTTMGYIGTIDAKDRRAKAIFQFDLKRLGNVL